MNNKNEINSISSNGVNKDNIPLTQLSNNEEETVNKEEVINTISSSTPNTLNKDNVNDKEDTSQSPKKESIFPMFYILMYYSFLVLSFFTQSGLIFIISLMILIAAKINYPHNSAIKIMFWFSIIVMIIIAILLFCFFSLLYRATSSCS